MVLVLVLKRDLCTCPDGVVRPKRWHLWDARDDTLQAVCGTPAFGDNAAKVRVPGARLPECFTEDWLRVDCDACLRVMTKGLPK